MACNPKVLVSLYALKIILNWSILRTFRDSRLFATKCQSWLADLIWMRWLVIGKLFRILIQIEWKNLWHASRDHLTITTPLGCSAAQSTMEFQRVLWTISERQGSQSRYHNVLYRAFVMLIHTNIHLVILFDDDHPKIIITYKRTFHSAHPIRPLKQQQQRPVHLSPHKQSTVFHSFSTSVEPKAPNESIQNSHHGGW